MATISQNNAVIKSYLGVDASANTDDRIFFVSDGSASLTANRPYWRDTSVSTPVDLTVGASASNNYTYRSVSSTGTLLAGDEYVGVNHVAPITLTFPQISSFSGGKHIYVVKDESGNASTNNITINTTGGDTIEGGATAVITLDYQSLSFYSDTTSNWSIF